MTKDIDALLAERGNTHGDYVEHAAITQQLKDIMRSTPGWARLSDIMRETLEMNAHKIGRILAGKPEHPDHWDDIAGYARLVSTRLTPIVTTHPMMKEAMDIIDDGAADIAAKFGANARLDPPTS